MEESKEMEEMSRVHVVALLASIRQMALANNEEKTAKDIDKILETIK